MTNVERRKLFRVEVIAQARFRLIDQKTLKGLTDWINGSTADISLGGVKITASMPEPQIEMMVDQYVLIEFSCQLPGTPGAIAATGSVAYFLRGAKASKATAVTFGLSFVDIDNNSKDVIGEFIRPRVN